MSKVSVSQAAKLTGKSRETINKATQTGALTYSLNAAKRKEIDVAELQRVYQLVTTIDALQEASGPVKPAAPVSGSDSGAQNAELMAKLASSERTIELIQSERDRERRQLESEIENLRSSLQRSQEQHGRALLLITDQSQPDRGEEWKAAIAGLEKRIANQEARQNKTREAARRRIATLQNELQAERSKPIVKRLWDALKMG